MVSKKTFIIAISLLLLVIIPCSCILIIREYKEQTKQIEMIDTGIHTAPPNINDYVFSSYKNAVTEYVEFMYSPDKPPYKDYSLLDPVIFNENEDTTIYYYPVIAVDYIDKYVVCSYVVESSGDTLKPYIKNNNMTYEFRKLYNKGSLYDARVVRLGEYEYLMEDYDLVPIEVSYECGVIKERDKTLKRPLIKIGNQLYRWCDEYRNERSVRKKVGQVEYSHDSWTAEIQSDDADYTSNVLPRGSEIYSDDSKHVIVKSRGKYSRWEKCSV